MCLGIPGQIISIDHSTPVKSGMINFGGLKKQIILAYVPEAEIGDYVIVHVGFAISKVDEEEAMKIFSYLEELGELKELVN